MKPIILLGLTISSFVYSQRISGSYAPFGSKCKIDLKIDHKNYFIFSLKKGKKIMGTVKLSKDDKITYLNFGNGIEAMWDNDTIYIQNSGNAMNPYIRFKECDEMYIHLARKKS